MGVLHYATNKLKLSGKKSKSLRLPVFLLQAYKLQSYRLSDLKQKIKFHPWFCKLTHALALEYLRYKFVHRAQL